MLRNQLLNKQTDGAFSLNRNLEGAAIQFLATNPINFQASKSLHFTSLCSVCCPNLTIEFSSRLAGRDFKKLICFLASNSLQRRLNRAHLDSYWKISSRLIKEKLVNFILSLKLTLNSITSRLQPNQICAKSAKFAPLKTCNRKSINLAHCTLSSTTWLGASSDLKPNRGIHTTKPD